MSKVDDKLFYSLLKLMICLWNIQQRFVWRFYLFRYFNFNWNLFIKIEIIFVLYWFRFIPLLKNFYYIENPIFAHYFSTNFVFLEELTQLVVEIENQLNFKETEDRDDEPRKK